MSGRASSGLQLVAPAEGIARPRLTVRQMVRSAVCAGGIPGFTAFMVWRSRLEQLLVEVGVLLPARRVRAIGQLLLGCGLVFLLLRLRSIWHDNNVDLSRTHWGWLIAAFVLAAVALVAAAFMWIEVLRRLGAPMRPRWAAIFLQAQLGKYVPGGLWQYAGRSALGRAHGVPLRLVGMSLPIEICATAYAASGFAVLLVGWWGIPGVAAVLIAAPIAGSLVPGRWTAFRIAARMSLVYAMTWPLIGVSFWMTARAFLPIPVNDLPIYAGVFAAAWIVGLVAIYAPGGLGVREAVIVALLRGRIGSADAAVVAVASRGILTSVDLVAAGAALFILRGRPTELEPRIS